MNQFVSNIMCLDSKKKKVEMRDKPELTDP